MYHQNKRQVCLGCECRIRQAAPPLIVNLPTRRVAPICDGCSLRARESSIWFEQLGRVLGLGHTVPSLRRNIKPRELPTTLAAWDAFEAEAATARLAR